MTKNSIAMKIVVMVFLIRRLKHIKGIGYKVVCLCTKVLDISVYLDSVTNPCLCPCQGIG